MQSIFKMKKLFQNIVTSPSLLSLILSLSALIFAMFLQYKFNLIPCYLCELQRYGYVVALLLAILGIKYKNNNIFPTLISIAFLAVFIIAFWHKGIEAYWWSPTSECTEMSYNIGTLQEELEKANTEKPTASCDQLSPTLLNITLVEWSLMYAFVSFISVTFLLLKRILGKKNEF